VKDKDYADLGWLAGIIDGEGCIAAYSKDGKIRLDVTVDTTSPKMEKHIRKIYKKHDIWHTECVKQAGKNSTRPVLRVRVAKKLGVIRLLKLLLPYLINKKQEAKALIEWYETKGHHDDCIVGELKRLKKLA